MGEGKKLRVLVVVVDTLRSHVITNGGSCDLPVAWRGLRSRGYGSCRGA